MAYWEMIYLALATIVLSSVIAAPVLDKDPPTRTQGQNEPQTTNGDDTAAQLEKLKESIVIPAAPVIEDFQTKENTIVQQPAKATVQQDVAEESEPISTSKRTYPMPQDLQLPAAFSGRDNRMSPREPDVDLSPHAVAQYLLVTNDFTGFDQAMSDLMNIGVLSPSEVMEYRDSVSYEYENMLRQMALAESQYLQELSRVSPVDYYNSLQQPAPAYPEYPYNQNSLEYNDLGINAQPQLEDSYQELAYPRQMADYREQMQQANIQKMLMDKQKSLDDVLSMVLQQYYNQQDGSDNTDVEYREEQPIEMTSFDKEPQDITSFEQEPQDDDTMKQFMAYLQRTLTSTTTGGGIIEIPDKFDQVKEKTEQVDPDVEKELNELPEADTENHSEESSDESSGDVDDLVKALEESSS